MPAQEVQHEVDDQVLSQQNPRRKKGVAKRTKNFDQTEDEALCSAWLNVSKDPIHGANQNRSKFWRRIHIWFDNHKKTTIVRTESSILHSWLTIQREVNKFCSAYEAIERRNQSGVTIQDMISQALDLYEEWDADNKAFTLIPCWTKLKEEDKWKTKRAELLEQEKQSRKKKKKTDKDATPTDVQGNGNEDIAEVAAPNSEVQSRPMGQKKAKEALKRGPDDAANEALDRLWAKEAFDIEKEKKKDERFLASLEIEKKRLAVEEKRAELDLTKEEKEIMQVDMASMTQLQREYFEKMQQIIVARRFPN